ncbi:MAG: hypothetical protein ACREOI_10825 [bacterium]
MDKNEENMVQTARQPVFKITPSIKREFVKIIDARIREAHVTKEDFSELKGIVADLAAAQKRTELTMEELAEAQKRTELTMEELAEAQKGTETTVNKLAESLHETRNELGGLSRSVGYAFENEAYRLLPEVLKRKYGIEITEKIIRSDIGGKEINILGRAEREGREVWIVGEAKLRLDERREKRNVFDELEDTVQAVISEYGQVEIVRVLVTHYAKKGFLDLAGAKGIIVVQSFEWI